MVNDEKLKERDPGPWVGLKIAPDDARGGALLHVEVGPEVPTTQSVPLIVSCELTAIGVCSEGSWIVSIQTLMLHDTTDVKGYWGSASTAPGDVAAGNPHFADQKSSLATICGFYSNLIRLLRDANRIGRGISHSRIYSVRDILLILLQLVEFLHHGNTQIRQIGKNPRHARNTCLLTPHQHVRTSLDSLQPSPASSSANNYFLSET